MSSSEDMNEWDQLLLDISAPEDGVDIQLVDNNTEIVLEKQVKDNFIVDYKRCPECDVQCKINDTIIICEQCGLEREWNCPTEGYSMSINDNYNTSDKAHIAFVFIGAKSFSHQRSLIKTSADYSSFRSNSNKKEIFNTIFQYDGDKPPLNVISDAADMFDKIKQSGKVYRKNGKKGVIAACLYYSCIMHGLTRPVKDIARIMGIDEKFLSHGDKILQELNELGVIEIPIRREPLEDYLNQFFIMLGIPDKYKAFVLHLINRAEHKHLHVKNECRPTTKCVGAIYLLTQLVPELHHIDKNTISRECKNISRTTFIKYFNLLIDNPRLIKKSFKKFGIPMPKSWRNK